MQIEWCLGDQTREMRKKIQTNETSRMAAWMKCPHGQVRPGSY